MTNAIDQTVSLLRSIPDARFVTAVLSLEQNIESADVQTIRNQIRDRLVKMRPPRRLNMTRLFCDPFEEMLRNAQEGEKSWIPRSAILPVWRAVERRIDPDVLAAVRNNVKTALSPTRQQLHKLGLPLWKAASKELGAIVAAARAGDAAALELFAKDAGILGHAEIMAGALQVAPAIQELKGIFPIRPLLEFLPEDRERLLAELKRIGAARQHDLRCIIHIVAHWSANPAQIFTLCASMDLGAATPLGKALVAQQDKVVVGLLEEQIDALKENLDSADLDFRRCAELVRVTSDALGSADELIKEERNSDAKGRIAQIRGELGVIVKDRLVAAAAQAVNSIWGAQDPQTVSSGQIELAEDAARTMSKCGKLGGGLGLEDLVGENIASSMQAIRGDVSDVISGLKRGSGQEQVAAAQTVVTNATRMMEILEGSDRAYEFFRAKETEIRTHSA